MTSQDFIYQSFTALSDEFVAEVLSRQERMRDEYGSNNYPITLNTTDFRVFITILHKLAMYGNVTHKDFPVIPGFGDDDYQEPIQGWAQDWLSGIGDTLNVEGI